MLQGSLVLLFDQLERGIRTTSPEDSPRVLAELERLKGITLQTLLSGLINQNVEPRPEEPLLDLEQVSKLLNIPLSRTRELARRLDGFPTKRIGKHIRVKPYDLWNWIDDIQEKGLAKELDHRYSRNCHDRRRT